MVGAAKLFGAALGFRDDGRGVMAADVVEGAELGVVAAHDDDGLAGDVGGEELAFFANLIEAADDLPGRAEDAGAFEFFDARVAIPGRGDRGGFFEWIGGIVEIEEVVDGTRVHLWLLWRVEFISRNGVVRKRKVDAKIQKQ